jgi:glycosyltransferase involved in cell wall biosynthesis
MGKRKLRILFVCHVADYSGASKLILNIASLVKEKLNNKIDFLLLQKGPLEVEFKKLGNILSLENKPLGRFNIMLNLFNKTSARKIDYYQYDLILINSIAGAWILKEIKKSKHTKLILYVHELKWVTQVFLNEKVLEDIKTKIDICLTPCKTVSTFWQSVLWETNIKLKELPYFFRKKQEINLDKSEKAIFTVGGCGTIEFRKGIDFFINTAILFKSKFPDLRIKFIWKGGQPNSIDYLLLKDDLIKLGLNSYCIISPLSDNVSDFYNSLDIFILTSREDPYPLVVLEAAEAVVPSICFNNAGGAVEFVEGNGKVVEYFNLESMTETIKFYYENKEELKMDGMRAKNKFNDLHQNEKIITDVFEEILRKK